MLSLKIEPWKVFKAVYDMCYPVGMGMLQYVPEDMSEETAKEFTNAQARGREEYSIGMDYVLGRQCKFGFDVKDGICTFDDKSWYDHTEADLKKLVEKLNKLAEEQAA